MRKKISYFYFIFLIGIFVVQAQKIPQSDKTIFSPEALEQKIVNKNGEIVTLSQVLEQNKGKVTVFDIWATWCKDCIEGLPQLKNLQQNNPDVNFVFLSVDKKEEAWKNGIDKYEIVGQHYWFDSGWKNEFNNYIDLNWVPRYLILDQNGNIAKYYAVKSDDPTIQATLDQLK